MKVLVQAALVGLLLMIGAPVGLEVEVVGSMAPELLSRIETELRAALEAETTVELVRLDAARAAAGTIEDIISIKLFAGPLNVHCIADRGPLHVEVDLAQRSHTWRPILDELVRRLLPDKTKKRAAVDRPPPITSPPESTNVAPLVVLGASAIAIAASAFFAISREHGLDRLRDDPLSSAEYDDLAGSVKTEGFAANILALAGVAGSVVGVVLLAGD